MGDKFWGTVDGHVVLVTGGRLFGEPVEGKTQAEVELEREFVWNCLNRVQDERGVRLVVTGACVSRHKMTTRGADGWAERWAVYNQVNYLGVPAKWNKLGARAGMKRNQEMLDLTTLFGVKPDAAIAFPGGVGTAGMRRLLQQASIPCWIPEFE
jgi:hypothetical protein